MMKTKNMFWVALSMTAALVMTACTSDDNMVETPAAPQAEVKTIPYSVTVNGGGAATNRATVDGDMKTLKFADGDKLYIMSSSTHYDVRGVLTLKSGDAGKSSDATFEGTISYEGYASPDDDLELYATLVGTKDKASNFNDAKDMVLYSSYPDDAFCADVNEAVEEYSVLMGTSTYSAKSFTLKQETAFLNFEITFEDGTTAGTKLLAYVSNEGYTIAADWVTTKTVDGKVMAKFVLPVSCTTTLSNASVGISGKASLPINDATLEGKVYNIRRTQELPNPYATAHVGDLFYSDGTFSSTLVAGKTPIGVIAYLGTDNFTENGTTVGGSPFVGHGLVLCLKNAASGIAWSTDVFSHDYTGNALVNDVAGLKRSTGVSGYSATVALATDAKHPAAAAARNYTGLTAPTGTTGWFLPSAQQWLKMIEGLGGLTDGAPNFEEDYFDSSHEGMDKWETALQKAGSGNYDSMKSEFLAYYSSSEYLYLSSIFEAVCLYVDPTGNEYHSAGFMWGGSHKTYTSSFLRVRPILAF